MHRRRQRIVVSVFAALSAGLVLSAQAPVFDVASIKRHAGADLRSFATVLPGQYRVINVPIGSVITAGWPAPMGIKNLPRWAADDRYDVEVKWPADTPREQLTTMWREMLAERMKLQVHYEEVDDPSFALTVARADGRLGKGLTRSTLDCDVVGAAFRAGQPMPDLPNGAGPCRMWEDSETILAGGTTMADLAKHLTGPSGRQVVDRTGLDGRWEFVLHYSRVERDPNAPLGRYPSLFSALQSELGLKLVPFVGRNTLLVIDRIAPPTEN